MKNFRCFTAILLIATMFISFSACSSDEENEETELTLNSESELLFENGINFTFEKGEQTISFFCNNDWNISITEPTNGEVWCTASLTSGKAGNQTVKVNVTENVSSHDRSVLLTIKAGDIEKNVMITQNGISENDDITSHFDLVFAQILEDRQYIPNHNKIKRSDVNNITSLDVHFSKISSMAGIQYFQALTTLSCNYNLLTSLDLSKNTTLINLDCSINKLTSLDLSKNTELTFLYCNYNILTTLDLSKNTEFIYLNCNNNQLTTLDISKNTKLIGLSCYDNPGDGTKFIVTAWFNYTNIPRFTFPSSGWNWNGNPISIEYQKAN